MKQLLLYITLSILLTGCASASAAPASSTTLVNPSVFMPSATATATPSLTIEATLTPTPIATVDSGQTTDNQQPSSQTNAIIQQPVQQSMPAPTTQAPVPAPTPTPTPLQSPGFTLTQTPTLAVTTTPTPTPRPAKKTCSDFATQKQAQAYFDSHGGSKSNDVDGLDHNHNGIACESLPKKASKKKGSN